MYGYEGVRVPGFRILHDYLGCVGVDGVGVVGGIVDGEGEFVYEGFVEGEEGEFVGVGCPPEGKVTREDLFFVYPVWDTVEEGGVSGGGYSDWGGVWSGDGIIRIGWRFREGKMLTRVR